MYILYFIFFIHIHISEQSGQERKTKGELYLPVVCDRFCWLDEGIVDGVPEVVDDANSGQDAVIAIWVA